MASTSLLGNLVVRFLGDTGPYKRAIASAMAMTRGFSVGVGKAMRVAQMGVGSIASAMGRIGAPIAAIGGLAVREFGKFDQAMVESTSIMNGITESQKKRMRELAKTLSQTSRQGPEELARSYYFLASAGMDAEQSMKALPAVTKFATAGAFDMARATDLLTDAQSALGLSSKDATENLRNMTRVSDVLIKANTLSNASAEQFSEAIGTKSGAALKTFNKDVEEGMAVLNALADQQIKGANAGEVLNRFITLLAKSSRDAADAHEHFGFKVFDAQGNMRNFADIIKNLEDITGDMSPEMRSATMEMLGFEARVQASINPLLGTSDAIRRYESELRKAGGTTDDVANKQMKSFSSQMKMVWNTVRTAAIEIGEVLAPYVQKAGLAIKDWLGKNLDGIVSKLKTFLKVAEFVFSNWKTIISYNVNLAIAGAIRLFNDFLYYNKVIIPGALMATIKIVIDVVKRMLDNFGEFQRFMKDVFFLLPDVAAEVFTIILKNANKFAKAVAAAIRGKGWDFAFEGLSDAFKEELGKLEGPDIKGPGDIISKHLKDMPKLADRPLSELEKQQNAYVRGLAEKMGKSWNDIFSEQPSDTDPEEAPPAEAAKKIAEKTAKHANEVEQQIRRVQGLLFGSAEAVRAGSQEFQTLLGNVRPATAQEPTGWKPVSPETAMGVLKNAAASKIPSTMNLLAKGIMRLVELEESKEEGPKLELEGMEAA